jgi:hypothetical protein
MANLQAVGIDITSAEEEVFSAVQASRLSRDRTLESSLLTLGLIGDELLFFRNQHESPLRSVLCRRNLRAWIATDK